MNFTKLTSWSFFLPLVVFTIDRFIKFYFSRTLEIEIQLIPKILRLTLHKNYGIGFSLEFPRTLIILLSLVILAALFFWLAKTKNKKTRFALVLIITGAISNLIDRLFYGFVVDYISVFNLSFLNLSDLLIFSGLVFLIRPSAK